VNSDSVTFGRGTGDIPAPGVLSRCLLVAFAITAGISVGFEVWWCAAAAVAVVAIVLALSRPELVIVLFVTAGLYKQDPRITGLIPYDVTVLLGVLLVIAVLPRIRHTRIPPQSALLVPLFAAAAWGLLSPANTYGAEKALLFCTLTALVTLSSVILIDSPLRLQRFLVALAVLGLVVSVDALRHQDAGQWGRLASEGSNPIALGRIGAIAFAFAWIRCHVAKSRLERLGMVAVLGFSAMCALASGSRGPVISTLVSLGLASAVTYSAHRRMPIALGPAIVCAALAMILIGLASGPTIPLHRFELLVSEDKGASILVRAFMFATAWKLTLANPLGLGIGGFERYAPLELRYPHNLLLEVGCELGWVPLATLTLFLAWAIWETIQILRREYSWHTLFLCVVFSSALMNAMVSGDLNDNRLLYATLLLPFTYRHCQKHC
jgi:hypothetical protein